MSRLQTDSVVEVLGGSPPSVARQLALHHPPFRGGAARIAGRDRLVRSLVSARVDLVLAGHTHVPRTRAVELTADGVAHRLVEVVAGTATSVRVRDAGRSWSLIRIDAGTITVEERYEAGAGWRTGSIARYARGLR